MLNRQRELTLPRLTAAPTATSSAYLLTLRFLWRQANHGGWCSSVCVTSNGECRGRTGFSHRTRPPMTEVGKQCFDGINNGGVGGTDCQDCGCLAQFRSYCTRKIKSAGQTMPSCKKGSGSGSGKGGKGSGKGSGAAMMG